MRAPRQHQTPSRQARYHGLGLLVGSANLAPATTATRDFGRYDRRAFWLLPTGRSDSADSPYAAYAPTGSRRFAHRRRWPARPSHRAGLGEPVAALLTAAPAAARRPAGALPPVATDAG
ncbi:DUF6009 family protein [Streptomyces sp. NPDC020800]|uniref:DUF6009 family protein n=1 Tax=Streptomyces sp. NPDC020800 TaxID=3365092 RepID=UPI003796153C